MEQKQTYPVKRIPYDLEYERELRDELTDSPPLPSYDERIGYGCYETKPAKVI